MWYYLSIPTTRVNPNKPTSEKTMDNRKWCNQDLMNYENRYKSAKADEKSQVKIEEIRDELKKIRNKRW